MVGSFFISPVEMIEFPVEVTSLHVEQSEVTYLPHI